MSYPALQSLHPVVDNVCLKGKGNGMKRHYFIGDDLADLKQIERELRSRGIDTPHIRVLSRDDAGVQKYELPQVSDFMKKDVVRATTRAAVMGVAAAVLVLLVSWGFGWPEAWGWTPFVFLAIVVLGFITWEGGLWGIQEPNRKMRRFEKALDEGKHILFVEVPKGDEHILRSVAMEHRRLQEAGQEHARTEWRVAAEKGWRRFIRWAP